MESIPTARHGDSSQTLFVSAGIAHPMSFLPILIRCHFWLFRGKGVSTATASSASFGIPSLFRANESAHLPEADFTPVMDQPGSGD
jgi:hypothetical protein